MQRGRWNTEGFSPCNFREKQLKTERTTVTANRTKPAEIFQFVGRQTESNDWQVAMVTVDGNVALPLRLDLANHSPTGFAWGYAGSGPAQLALALCAALVDDETATRVYQQIKDELVVPMPRNYWSMSAATVARAISNIDPLGICPHCTWTIGYSSWRGSLRHNAVTCPVCECDSDVDTIYPPAIEA